MNRSTIIKIDNLSYSYPDGTRALENISLEIFAGEKVGLIGPNGAGKSTLVLHLNGIISGNGNIRIGDLPVVKKNFKQIRQKVGLVFQNSDDQLFCPTVYDDVAFGPRNLGYSAGQVEKAVRRSLAAVDLAGLERRSSYHLSAGQKRRLAIATVLAMNAEILVLDEPTSSLDPRGRRQIIQLLAGMDKTLLVATHDLDLLRQLCRRAVVMSKGSLVADGAVEAIIANHDLLREHGLL